MASGNDMRAAAGTYSGFLVMLKWGSAITAVIVAMIVMAIA